MLATSYSHRVQFFRSSTPIAEPKVTVCIASYNHAPYVGQAIDSVLQQTYSNFELVIVDDGSSDDSRRIIDRYVQSDPRVRLLTHPDCSNRGVSASFNLAVNSSDGDLVAWIGSDDMMLPQFLERQVSTFASRPEYGFVCGRALTIDAVGNRLPGVHGVDLSCSRDPVWTLLHKNLVAAPTVVMRRACLNQIGLCDESLLYSDWELWLRILSHWEVGFIPEPLVLYRVHTRNVSVEVARASEVERILHVLSSLRSKVLNVGGRLAEPANLALLDLQWAAFSFFAGRGEEAQRGFRGAMHSCPALVRNPWFWIRWLWFWHTNGIHQLRREASGLRQWALARLGEHMGSSMRELVMIAMNSLLLYDRMRYAVLRCIPGQGCAAGVPVEPGEGGPTSR